MSVQSSDQFGWPRSGLDRLLNGDWLNSDPGRFGRTGWLVNGSAVTGTHMQWAPIAASQAGFRVDELFGPEHGPHSAVAEGVPVAGHRDPWTGVHVCSLYGSGSGSGSEQISDALARIDTVFIDLPDNGARYSTYPATLVQLLDAVAEHVRPPRVVVLDRPNILGRKRSGPGLTPGFESIVGRLPVPVRHGLTLGELARLHLSATSSPVDLQVVPVRGWDGVPVIGQRYLPPSPNLNCFSAQLLYLGTCLFEGTNVSEGRGTANPFQQFGAPWLDAVALADQLRNEEWPGLAFRPVSFVPSTSKHQGELCNGVFVHLTDSIAADPIRCGVRLLELVFAQSGQAQLRAAADGPGPVQFLDRLWGDSDLGEHLLLRNGSSSWQYRPFRPQLDDIALYPL